VRDPDALISLPTTPLLPGTPRQELKSPSVTPRRRRRELQDARRSRLVTRQPPQGDALIVASAIETGCDILYTEDMQHGRAFGGLAIVNPFVEIAP
jgi:hypothetical protein